MRSWRSFGRAIAALVCTLSAVPAATAEPVRVAYSERWGSAVYASADDWCATSPELRVVLSEDSGLRASQPDRRRFEARLETLLAADCPALGRLSLRYEAEDGSLLPLALSGVPETTLPPLEDNFAPQVSTAPLSHIDWSPDRRHWSGLSQRRDAGVAVTRKGDVSWDTLSHIALSHVERTSGPTRAAATEAQLPRFLS